MTKASHYLATTEGDIKRTSAPEEGLFLHLDVLDAEVEQAFGMR